MTKSALILFLILSSICVYGQMPEPPKDFEYKIETYRVFPDTFHLTTEYYSKDELLVYSVLFRNNLPDEIQKITYLKGLIVNRDFYRDSEQYRTDNYNYSGKTVSHYQIYSDSSGFLTIIQYSDTTFKDKIAYKSYEFYENDTSLIWMYKCDYENGELVSELSEELDGWKHSLLIKTDTLIIKVDSTFNNGYLDSYSKKYEFSDITIDTTFYIETGSMTVTKEYFDKHKFNFKTEQYGRTIPICTDNGRRHQTFIAKGTPDYIYIRKKKKKNN